MEEDVEFGFLKINSNVDLEASPKITFSLVESIRSSSVGGSGEDEKQSIFLGDIETIERSLINLDLFSLL